MGPGVSSKQYEVHLGERALLFLALRIRKEEKKLAKKKRSYGNVRTCPSSYQARQGPTVVRLRAFMLYRVDVTGITESVSPLSTKRKNKLERYLHQQVINQLNRYLNLSNCMASLKYATKS